MPQIKRILCPVDFSETSEHALRYGVDLAAGLGAGVELLHVYQLPSYALPDGAILARPKFAANLMDALQHQVQQLVERHEGRGAELTGRIVEGIAYVEIDRIARERDADLIVMGTHGRTGLTHLLVGSVAERVVRMSEVPVLTVRRPQ